MRRFRIGLGGRPLAHRIQKLGHVFGIAALAADGAIFGRTWLPLLPQKRAERSAARKDHITLGAVKRVAVVEAVQAIGRERIVLIDQQPTVGILVRHVHVVWIFAGVAEQHHPAAARRDLLGQRVDAQSPGGHVQIVNPVVADLAVAIVAKHPPRAMEPVGIERMLRRRPQPAIVVDARWRRAVGKRLGFAAHFGRPRPGDLHFADQALGQQLAGLQRHGAGAHLAPLLHYAAIFLGRGDNQWPLVVHVRDRLFDIDVFAGLHQGQRDRRVPVMRRGDDARVHLGVGHQVLEARRRAWAAPTETPKPRRPSCRSASGRRRTTRRTTLPRAARPVPSRGRSSCRRNR